MKLDQLFEKGGWTEHKLAVLAGTGQPTINRLRRGDRTASLGLAFRIERATDGQVRAEDVPLSKKSRRDLRLLRKSFQGSPPSDAGEAA